MTSQHLSIFMRRIQNESPPWSILGAPRSALALLLLQKRDASESPLLLLCPNAEVIQEWMECFETLSSFSQLSPKIRILPTWETSPYLSTAPSLKVRWNRISTLCALAQKQVDILISTPAALLQRTWPPELLRQHLFSVHKKENLSSREEFVQRLRELGYQKADPVEDPGTFLTRGEIIDLFVPGQSNPFRLELFDTEVERIRTFDPDSQKSFSSSDLDKIDLYPAREVFLPPNQLSHLKQEIKKFSDDLGISRKIRDPLIEDLEAGIYPTHADSWMPFISTNAANALNYLDSEWKMAWDDRTTCLENLEDFFEEQMSRFESALQSGLIAPHPEELFSKNFSSHLSSEFFFNEIQSHSQNPPLTLKISPSESIGNGALLGRLSSLSEKTQTIVIFCKTESSREKLSFLLHQRGLSHQKDSLGPHRFSLYLGSLPKGFYWPEEGVGFLTEDEIFGKKTPPPKKKDSTSAQEWSGLRALSDLEPEDSVVHLKHGIGKYKGLTRLKAGSSTSDFLTLEYAGGDKLYIPVYKLNLIQKYLGAGEVVSLDRLGGARFAKAKEKVRNAVKKLAFDLVQLYAKRSLQKGKILDTGDPLFEEMERQFPFEETEDQLRAIQDVLADLSSGKVMDRLICGDVGFGKTEVAIRAAFAAVLNKKQVVVLVPTTLLAFQHENSFKERLKSFPLRIESLSRFKKKKEQEEIIHSLKKGEIDILIGTHRILSKDVDFQNLGLIIVDEEHRFGVEAKEKLKTLRVNTHVLTLTATPIPRTLHFSLSGLRDISLIRTPPVDRHPIRTSVSPFDENLIRDAIQTELERGGQVFFLHNRVQSIYKVAERLQALIPGLKLSVAHGQMQEKELEREMLSFYHKESQVLVCTSIIESGLDIPLANTILIDRADTFGLAQLYQLRGRVGRSDRRAYAYLLISSEQRLTEEAKKRLDVIQRFVELGSGFHIASHDLEIRGGGNLLGPEQSGHIASVGFDLYTELLGEAVKNIQNESTPIEEPEEEIEIKSPFSAFLDETYIPDIHQRLGFYRKLSHAKTDTEIDQTELELKDRYGVLPEEAQNLLWVVRIKLLLRAHRLSTIIIGPHKTSLSLFSSHSLQSHPLARMSHSRIQISSEGNFIWSFSSSTLKDYYFELLTLLTPSETLP